MELGGWRVRALAIGVVLFTVGLVILLRPQHAPINLPLAFGGFTNSAGEASALFRLEMPALASVFNLQTLDWGLGETHVRFQDGSVSTNAFTLKPADFSFPPGSNAIVQIRVTIPTNAATLSVTYGARLTEGFSIGSMQLYVPRVKHLSFQSENIAVHDSDLAAVDVGRDRVRSLSRGVEEPAKAAP